jgi:hypothetical protein
MSLKEKKRKEKKNLSMVWFISLLLAGSTCRTRVPGDATTTGDAGGTGYALIARWTGGAGDAPLTGCATNTR